LLILIRGLCGIFIIKKGSCTTGSACYLYKNQRIICVVKATLGFIPDFAVEERKEVATEEKSK
jgi:hypothetical protein